MAILLDAGVLDSNSPFFVPSLHSRHLERVSLFPGRKFISRTKILRLRSRRLFPNMEKQDMTYLENGSDVSPVCTIRCECSVPLLTMSRSQRSDSMSKMRLTSTISSGQDNSSVSWTCTSYHYVPGSTCSTIWSMSTQVGMLEHT